MPKSIALNIDCMEYMKDIPDKAFDLAVVDPPYRDEKENRPTKDMRKNGKMSCFGNRPNNSFFNEIFRVSKNQIIWGANNFSLPPYKGFLIWKKTNIPENFTMSMAEMAFISEGLGTISKVFRRTSQGETNDKRIHPTQKPVALYEWIFQKYAKPGDRVLDTHLGSGSSRIAAYKAGLDFVGCEIDPDYFNAQEERFQNYIAQTSLFY